jgi:uncharacterized protein
VEERETEALVARLEGVQLVSSELVETELRRVALRAGAYAALPAAERLIAQLTTIPITPAILRQAGALEPASLRSLDAIHLATAMSLDSIASGFVCYDVPLRTAATDRGLEIVAPS